MKIKTVQAIITISMLIYMSVILIAPDYESIAIEKAWADLSYTDSIVISDFFDNYEKYIDPSANSIDTITIISFWVMILGIVYQTSIVFSLDTHERRTE